MSTERKRPVISDGLPSQLPDIDPEETHEWVESLDGVIDERGAKRARYVMLRLLERARERQVGVPPLTTSGVDQMIRNVGELAGVGKRVYPHLLRHSFATWQLSRGMNPIQLAQILGHSSLTMIQAVYSHLSPVDAYEAVLRTYREEEE